MRDSNPRGVAACLVSGELHSRHSANPPKAAPAPYRAISGAEPPRASRMAAGCAINCFYMTRPLSGAGCLSDEVFLELDPSARFRLAVLFIGDNGESPVFQPGYDSSQFRCIEHLYCLLYRQPPARHQVGKDLALWVSYHILVVLVCTRCGGQATPGKSFRLRGSLRIIAR